MDYIELGLKYFNKLNYAGTSITARVCWCAVAVCPLCHKTQTVLGEQVPLEDLSAEKSLELSRRLSQMHFICEHCGIVSGFTPQDQERLMSQARSISRNFDDVDE